MSLCETCDSTILWKFGKVIVAYLMFTFGLYIFILGIFWVIHLQDYQNQAFILALSAYIGAVVATFFDRTLKVFGLN
jgi:hypothetical protein